MPCIPAPKSLKMDQINIKRRRLRNARRLADTEPCDKLDHLQCKHAGRRKWMIDAWKYGTGSARVRGYWWGYERLDEPPEPRFKKTIPGTRNAMKTVIQIVTACNGEEFTSRDILFLARRENKHVHWSTCRIARLITYNRIFLGLEKVGTRSGNVVWKQKDGALSGGLP